MEPPVIFVIDDDASVRTAIRRLLLALHLPIRLFESAEQFLADVDGDAQGCLILDLRLPGMTGLQLQERLVKDQWNLPTIVLTAHLDNTMRDAALQMGAASYLQKPFDPEQLLHCVHAAMVQKQP
jgi:FixJ family two-component response regulator